MTFRSAIFPLAGLCLIAGAIFALVAIARSPLQPPYRTRVTVTSIGYQGHKYALATAEIHFRSEGGLEGSFSTPPANLSCKVGDSVPAIQQGTNIELAPGACQKMTLP